MDGGACSATVHGVAKGRTQLSDFTFFSFSLKISQLVYYLDIIVQIAWKSSVFKKIVKFYLLKALNLTSSLSDLMLLLLGSLLFSG